MKNLIFKNYNYSVPVIIFLVIAGFSVLNNFGWDFVKNDWLTYSCVLFGGYASCFGYNQLKNPLRIILYVMKGLLPAIKDMYSNVDQQELDSRKRESVLKLINSFEDAINEYENDSETNSDDSEVINDSDDSEEETKEGRNNEEEDDLCVCTDCSCSDDDDGECC